MSQYVNDCPRCNAKSVTFDLRYASFIQIADGWQKVFETFCVCRHCRRGTIFVLGDKSPQDGNFTVGPQALVSLDGTANLHLELLNIVTIKDRAPITPPEYLPENILSYFKEGAQCMAVACYNAAGTMFRLCLDSATKEILVNLPAGTAVPQQVQRSLGHRLPWLISNKHLSDALSDLAECVKEDGNDGAHDGTLTRADAEDLRDFTVALLERLYTEPAKLIAAKERRLARRAAAAP